MNINTIKQAGFKALAQLASEIREYCDDVVHKSETVFASGCGILSDNIVNTIIASRPVWIDDLSVHEVTDEARDEFYYALWSLQNETEAVRETTYDSEKELYITLTNQYGEVYTFTKLASQDLVDGAGNTIYNHVDKTVANVIHTVGGKTYPLAQLIKDQMNNCQMYDTLSACIQNALNQGDSTFESVRSMIIDKYGEVRGDSLTVLNDARASYQNAGLAGIMAWAKNWFSCMNTATTDPDDTSVLHFTDNSAFIAQNNLAGCLVGMLGTAASVAGAIVTAVAPIVGMVISGIGMAINFGLNLAANAMDANVYGTIRFKENGNYCYPQALMQGSETMARLDSLNQSRNKAYVKLREILIKNGSVTFTIPGGEVYAWMQNSALINYEVHVTPFAKTCSVRSMLYHYLDGNTGLVPCLDQSDVWDCYENDLDMELAELKNKRWSPADLDGELRARYYYNYTYVVAYMLSQFHESGAPNLYLKIPLIDTPANYAPISYWFNDLNPNNQHSFYTQLTWVEIYRTSETMSWLMADSICMKYDSNAVYLYRYNGSTYEPTARCLTDLRHGYNAISSVSTSLLLLNAEYDLIPVSSFGEWYIQTPATTWGSVIGALLATAAIAAAAIITTVALKKTITKAKSRKKATLARNIETSWEAFKDNPSAENYDNYYKAVKKNNRWAKFLGGTSYSMDGMWGEADSGDSSTASADSGFLVPKTQQLITQQLESRGILQSDNPEEPGVMEKLDSIIGLLEDPNIAQKLDLIINLIRGA